MKPFFQRLKRTFAIAFLGFIPLVFVVSDDTDVITDTDMVFIIIYLAAVGFSALLMVIAFFQGIYRVLSGTTATPRVDDKQKTAQKNGYKADAVVLQSHAHAPVKNDRGDQYCKLNLKVRVIGGQRGTWVSTVEVTVPAEKINAFPQGSRIRVQIRQGNPPRVSIDKASLREHLGSVQPQVQKAVTPVPQAAQQRSTSRPAPDRNRPYQTQGTILQFHAHGDRPNSTEASVHFKMRILEEDGHTWLTTIVQVFPTRVLSAVAQGQTVRVQVQPGQPPTASFFQDDIDHLIATFDAREGTSTAVASPPIAQQAQPSSRPTAVQSTPMSSWSTSSPSTSSPSSAWTIDAPQPASMASAAPVSPSYTQRSAPAQLVAPKPDAPPQYVAPTLSAAPTLDLPRATEPAFAVVAGFTPPLATAYRVHDDVPPIEPSSVETPTFANTISRDDVRIALKDHDDRRRRLMFQGRESVGTIASCDLLFEGFRIGLDAYRIVVRVETDEADVFTSQDIQTLTREDVAKVQPGAQVAIRYDQANPQDLIVMPSRL